MIRRWAWCSSKSMSIRPRVKKGPTRRVHAGPLAKALSLLRKASSQASGPSSSTALVPKTGSVETAPYVVHCRSISATGSLR